MEKIKLDDCCKLIARGYQAKKNEIIEEDETLYSYLKYSDINKDIDEETYILANKRTVLLYSIEQKDIILPLVARETLNVKFIDTEYEKSIYSSNIVFLRVDTNKFIPEFIYRLFCNKSMQKRLLEEVYEGKDKFKNLKVKKLENFEIPYITVVEQEDILFRYEMREKEIHELDDKLNKLSNFEI